MEYKNFFESQKEAAIRLNDTVVLYDGEPVRVVATSDHVGDGVIRAYVQPIGDSVRERSTRPEPDPHQFHPVQSALLGKYLDEFIAKHPNSKVVRKRLDSPKFNKFRPYELGMYWDKDRLYYVERQPNRLTQQGLIPSMLVTKTVNINSGVPIPVSNLDMYGPEMRRCIMGEHPSPQLCLERLRDQKYANEAAAFHRHFALVRGPVNTLFFAYKGYIIGHLPNEDFSTVKLSRDFSYTKEVVSELGLFNNILV